MRLLTVFALVVFSSSLTTQGQDVEFRKNSDVTSEEDPFLWLEDVTGEAALDWVRARNEKSKEKLETDSSFAELEGDLLKILNSDERIPFVSKRGDFFYNFWQDKNNERGIWRRTTLEEYKKAEPKWDVLLDLDKLAAEEHESWVWKGAQLLRPDYDRALISLSRGGADATVTREFDLTQRIFPADGFFRSEAKGALTWVDRDTVFVYTNFGDGSLTDSGYPRIAKRWKRGTSIESAEIVFEGVAEDMSVSASHDDSPGFERDFVSRRPMFFSEEVFWLAGDGSLRKIDVPDSVEKSVFRKHLFLQLRESWEVEGKEYAAGSLLAAPFDKFMNGEIQLQVLFEPTENTSLDSFSPTKDYVLLNVLEDVKNRLYVLKEEPNGWQRSSLKGVPEFGTISAGAVDADDSNAYWLTSSDYITPTTLYYGEIEGTHPVLLKQLAAQYDSSDLQVQQFFTASLDGTKVPYFVVARKDLELNGNNPTLLYGYGGFEISLTPNYSATVGRGWLSLGGVYVVANIRGGGEYGPRWHQSALKANRLRAYEDFAAVAQDLIARKITCVEKLGIQGGSNGGLLVGNMVAIYPHLFSAAVCQVPLLDMRRYHLLLAGASWMAEYGDPDSPGEWSFIRTYSPYQNIKSDTKYPSIFFTTSTRDDRVHPGHARKMMALMESQNHDVLYYENIEGGHGGAANNKQRAHMLALAYTFLKDKLFK
ncbi:MAG: S9 family peptidase [Planctomycetales bacterium]|nr:S9 family peptidase [Planctomycetales bacterium]